MKHQKHWKRGLAAFFILVMFFGIIGTYPAGSIQAASQSSAEKEIAKLENDIKKWEKELAEYKKKADKATKGCIYVFYGHIEVENPLVIQGGLTNLNVPYLHVTNYNITFTDALIGAITGYFRALGTHRYKYNGQLVPDYEKVYAYEDERTALKTKIAKAEEKLKQLKQDTYAEFVLTGDKKITLRKGQDFTVEYQLSQDVSDRTITWTSSNKEVATVSKNGVIKAKAIGTAKITGKAKINGKTIAISVTVKEPLKSISLKTKSVTLTSGETAQIKKTVSPAKSYAAVTWLCSDISVATVDQNGLVTAIAPGTAYIYAYTDNKKISNACKVTVKGEAVSYEKASNATAAIAMVKASGYLENGVEYFFETERGRDDEYLVIAYPTTEKYLEVLAGTYKIDEEHYLSCETYVLKSGGKKIYFYKADPGEYYTDYSELKSYSMISGLAFRETKITCPQGAYQELFLDADKLAQMDYVCIASANPEIAEVVFSADNGKIYVQGISVGKTTVTAESKNGQKTTLSVEVVKGSKTKEETLADAEKTWVQENMERQVKPGDEKCYERMNEYLWWVNWFAADSDTKLELYYEKFEEDENSSFYDFYDYVMEYDDELDGWAESVTEFYADNGITPESVQENYEHYRNLYENGGVENITDSNYQKTTEYKNYIAQVEEEYEKQQKNSKCENPITAKNYKGKYRDRRRYSNKDNTPFDYYYVFAEKGKDTLVIAGEAWYEHKFGIKEDWLVR